MNPILPKDWKLATSTPPPDIPEDGADTGPRQLPTPCAGSDADQTEKGTWLTNTELKDGPQDLAGIWTNSNPSPENGIESLERFERTGSELRIYGNLSDSSGYWVDLKATGGENQWTGTGAPPPQQRPEVTGYTTCPAPSGTCPKLCKWSAGYLNVDGLRATGRWDEYQDDPTTCTYTTEKTGQDQEFTRVVGVSFAPLECGRYMGMVMAPAVGPNPAQFKSLVRLVTNYDQVPGATSVKTTVSPAKGIVTWRDGDKQGLKSTYEFSAKEHGTYDISFDLVRSGGQVFHTDRVRIEIPEVPGIGN
jgi:hypothetical protein